MSTPLLRRVELGRLDQVSRLRLLQRSAVPDAEIRRRASSICEEVRAGGDRALRRLAARLGGGFRPLAPEQLARATDRVESDLRAALESSIGHVERFHRAQLPSDLSVETSPGVEVSRRWTPLRRVGAYVPGGRAVYPSTVVMTVVPAKVVGVAEVVVASPAGPDGSVADALLAACHLAGADEVWVMGGAQAIAALAYGTESVRPVQKVVGPGNAWVTAAKLAVYGACAIDLPAGPSEVLVLADRTADPRLVAIDLLCQAEHGPDSPAVLVTDDPRLPERVDDEIRRLLVGLDRAQVLRRALLDHGQAVIAPDRESALDLAEAYAAEHVSIMTADPEADAKRLTAAGSVFIGPWSAESAGDYATGANHVLPTGGLAAACGPLGVEDFGSWRQEQRLTREGLAGLRPIIATLAGTEGLTAHRLAADLRFDS